MKIGPQAAFLICSACLLWGGSAAAQSNKTKIAPPETEPLIAYTLVQQAGWDYNWQINLPLKKGEQINRIHVFGTNLFVLTDSNLLFCIDQATGRMRSLLQISKSGLPTSLPSFYEGKAAFVVGNEVQVFDPSSGTITFRKRFPQIGNSQGALARNSKHLFVAGSDNRLHAINTDGYWQEFEASADNDSAIVSIVATDSIVIFATQAGNVVGMSPDRPQKVWQFDATGAIQGHLELDEESVYFGSEDSKLYRLKVSDGTLLWPSPFHSGGPIRNGLTVGRRIVYVYNDLNGLYGINKETGKPVWHAPTGASMICETNDKAFVYCDPGLLKVMDNNSGQELYSMNLAEVNRIGQNRVSPVLFLGDGRGRLVSITVK